MLTYLALGAFLSQLLFMSTRTWNIQATASNNTLEAVISTCISGLAFLAGSAIGINAITECIKKFDYEGIIILLFYVFGQALGTWIKMDYYKIKSFYLKIKKQFFKKEKNYGNNNDTELGNIIHLYSQRPKY